jgi:hypothetical protein
VTRVSYASPVNVAQAVLPMPVVFRQRAAGSSGVQAFVIKVTPAAYIDVGQI